MTSETNPLSKSSPHPPNSAISITINPIWEGATQGHPQLSINQRWAVDLGPHSTPKGLKSTRLQNPVSQMENLVAPALPLPRVRSCSTPNFPSSWPLSAHHVEAIRARPGMVQPASRRRAYRAVSLVLASQESADAKE
jgi:hypothetical protein